MSTARLIEEQYVKTGQVRIVFKNYPVHGQEANTIAQATLCASEQGKFWEYHDNLMEGLYAGDYAAFGPGGLNQLAADLGLNGETFTACLNDGKYAQQVQDEALEAQGRGVSGTPAFFVNDTLIVGAKPFDVFKAAIEQELAGG